MAKWIRTNADRLWISGTGVTVAVVGIAIQDRDAVTIALVTLGVVVFIFGVILRSVRWFSIGPKGLEARLERLEDTVERVEKKVDQIVQVPMIPEMTAVFQPGGVEQEES